MEKLKVLDLFSGIGGFSLGLERTGGFETVGFCEIEPFCQQVLRKHWPDVPIYEDVRNLSHDGPIDVITGGYPCQPFSTAGQRKGADDDRHLWPAMFDCIKEHRPSWVCGENVAGHISMGIDDVLSDLESEDYAFRTFIIPACALGAPHRRDRVWIVAHAQSQRHGAGREQRDIYKEGGGQVGECRFFSTGPSEQPENMAEDVSDINGDHVQGVERSSPDTQERKGQNERPAGPQNAGAGRIRKPEPGLGRGPDGVSDWLDGTWEYGIARTTTITKNRAKRLKALGNAVVPQIPEMIGHAILKAGRQYND
jgi:DNA (cytosine-5)-methyltransferase 1